MQQAVLKLEDRQFVVVLPQEAVAPLSHVQVVPGDTCETSLIKSRQDVVAASCCSLPTVVTPALAVGRTLTLSAAALDSEAKEIPGTANGFRWSVSDSSVARLTTDRGRSTQVRALAPGRVTVTASYNGTVQEVPLVVGKGYTLTEMGPRLERIQVTNLNEHGHLVGASMRTS